MFTTEMVIVTEPQVKQANRTGVEFAVARGAIRKKAFDRRIGADVVETTYMGLIAEDAMIDELMALGVGVRVKVGGEVRRDVFNRRDGAQGSDLKLVVKRMIVLEEVPDDQEDDDGWSSSLVTPNGARSHS